MNKTLPVLLAFTAALGFSGAAGAGLINRGGGLIYDDVLNITWLQDANLAATEAFGLTRSVDEYPTFGTIGSTGLMSWFTADAWITAMNAEGGTGYLGFNNWRLPTVEPIGALFNYSFSNNATTDLGYAKTTTDGADGGWRDSAGNPVSEMGHMYYVNLANKGYCTPNDVEPGSCAVQLGYGLTNTNSFINLNSYVYWGTEYAPGSDDAWLFATDVGDQFHLTKDFGAFYAWAVRSGDVAAIPEPASIALVGLGLVGLGWVRRRRG